MSPTPPRISAAIRPSLLERPLDLDWDSALDEADPFPPAKSDDEIAALVDQMGAELGVFDPVAFLARHAVVRARPAPRRAPPVAPPPQGPRRPRAATFGPPPLPYWAEADTHARLRVG